MNAVPGSVTRLLDRWLRHTNTAPRPGSFAVPLPSAALTVLVDVDDRMHYARVVLITSDGGVRPVTDPEMLADALDRELADRAGEPDPLAGAGAPAAEHVAPPVADPVVPDRAGEWRLRPVRPHGADLATVVGWMRLPHVRRFYGQPWPDGLWADELAQHGPGSGSVAVFAERTGGRPVAMLEVYRPARHRLAAAFPTAAEDLGVHVCVGDVDETGRGTGSALLAAVGRGLLDANPATDRVLAEPDFRNHAAIGAFRKAGFEVLTRIALPHKHAAIVALERGPSA